MRAWVLLAGAAALVQFGVSAAGVGPPTTRAEASATASGAPRPPRVGTGRIDAPALTRRPPIVFEANAGQFDAATRFVARAPRFRAWFAEGEVVLDARTGDDGRDTLRMRLAGADVTPRGGALLPGVSNYFLGDDPTRWVTGAAHHAEVTYTDVAPGVDLTWRSTREADLEYVLTAAPGADAERFEIAFDGALAVDVTRVGDLVVTTAHGEFVHSRPVAWQESDTGRRAVACRFDVRGADRVGFRVGPHDRSRRLLVDPVLTGSVAFDPTAAPQRIAADSSGNVWVVGKTGGLTYSAAGGAQTAYGGGTDGFVHKLRGSDLAVLASTYFGGSGSEECAGVAVGSDGAVYVGGSTSSSNFPTQSPFQASYGGNNTSDIWGDGFVFKLSSSAASIGWSTYLGGSGSDNVASVIVDANGSAAVCGRTTSSDFPIASGYQSTFAGGRSDGFVTRFSAAGTTLVRSTYFGSPTDDALHDLAGDSAGNLWICGGAGAGLATTSGAYQVSHAGGVGNDALVAKLGSHGATLSWATYIGGSAGWDGAIRIAVGSTGTIHVMGMTRSTDFPVTSGSHDTTYGGVGGQVLDDDGWVAHVDSDGSGVRWATFLGGSGRDVSTYPAGLAVSPQGNVWIGGITGSTDLPLVNPVSVSSASYGFVSQLSSNGATLRFSTYAPSAVFGTRVVGVTGLTMDSSGQVFVCGGDGGILKFAPSVPTAPTTFTATPLSDRAVRIDWDGADLDGGSFEVDRAPADGAFARVATPDATAVTHTDTPLAGETSYDYRLRGTNVSGSSEWTSTVRVTTGPRAPASLTATMQSNTRVSLAWTDRSGAETGFHVERRAGAAGTWTRIAAPSANATSLLDASAPPESALSYRVRAVNAHAPSEWSAEATVTTSPANPGPRTPANLPGGSASITWNDVSMAEKGYELQRAPGSPGTQWTTIALLPANTTGYTDATVEPESVWSYRVRAFNDLGASDWVSLGSLTTGPYAPTDLAAEALSPTRAAVSWTDRSKMEVGYEVLRSEDGIYVPVADLPANATGLAEGSLSQETEYTYRVRTFNQHGKSAWAEVAVRTPSALVVRSVKIVRGTGRRPKPSVLTATGEFDVGGTGIDLASDATFVVGGTTFDVSGMTQRKGVWSFASDSFTLGLTPAKTGQSRVTFKLTMKGASVDALDPEGETVFAYRNGPFDASGLVALSGGRFAIGRDRLVDPALVVSSFAATLRGNGRDSLKVTGYFDASGGLALPAPDVVLRLEGFEFRAKGTEFRAAGDRLTFSIRATAGGVRIGRKVVLDQAKGTVQVTLTGADLGEFETGAIPVVFSLEVGDAKCGDTYIASCDGKSLRY